MKVLLAFAALAISPLAWAADPIATSLESGFTFEEFTGSAAVGSGSVNINRTLFFVDEQVVGPTKGWTVFFDPAHAGSVTATLSFDRPIVAVYIATADYINTTPIYAAPGINYGSTRSTGLEGADRVSFTIGGTSLQLDWSTFNRGDAIRVVTEAPLVTQVPEPGTQAMLAGGLALLAWIGLRRSNKSR